MESRKTDDASKIWQEDPLETYREFLKYANDEVRAGVEYNRSILSALSVFGKPTSVEVKAEEAKDDLKVATHDGEFYPFKTVMSEYGLYCCKITLTNFTNAFFLLEFSDRVYPRTVKFFITDEDLGEKAQVAYRNIVPSEFAQARQLAGPMGYHEYLIDGKNCDADGLKVIRFFISSDLQNTPIKIVIKDCSQTLTRAMGITQEEFLAIFEDKDEKKVTEKLEEESKVSAELDDNDESKTPGLGKK